jgi:hypothetical protein
MWRFFLANRQRSIGHPPLSVARRLSPFQRQMTYNGCMSGENERLDRDRLGVVAGSLMLALTLSRFVDLPVRPWSLIVFGSPLGFAISGTTVMLILIGAMTVIGVETVARSHPLARRGELEHSYPLWILPGLLSLALAGWLNQIDNLNLWALVILGGSVLIVLALAAEYAAVDVQQRSGTLLYWCQTALIYLVALILFTLLYDMGARGLVSGTAVVVVAFLLTVRLLWPLAEEIAETAVYGVVVGLLLGQLIWVLNYWSLSGLHGGLLLLLLFYVVTGLIMQSRNGRFSRQVVLEYVTVAALGLVAINVLL